MHRYFALILVFTLQSIAHSAELIPSEFIGNWVPNTSSCSSTLIMQVTANLVAFHNSKELRTYSNVEPCFSCEGGARYNGIVVWVTTTGSDEAPFIIYFNENERKGKTKVEILSAELKSKFSLDQIDLKKCKDLTAVKRDAPPKSAAPRHLPLR